MKKLLLAAAMLAVASPVVAAGLDLTNRMLAHIDWITANSDLEYHGEELPLVFQASPRELQIMRYGMQMVLDAEASESTVLLNVEAVYEYRDNVLFLSTELSAEYLPHVLVHETVHYLQLVNGHFDAAPCISFLERDAYAIQEKWQDAHDDPNPRPDPFTVVMVSTCERGY